jgi:predicted DNA binding CopG/RHH family protein
MSKATKVPRFQSEADEASWWDRNPDFFADCFDKASKKGEILHAVPKTGTLIRIPVKDARTARRLAAHNRLPYKTYVQRLLRQALEKERLAG